MVSDWSEISLATVAVISSGKRPGRVLKVAEDGCQIPVIGGGGISGFTDSALFEKGVLITGRVGTLGKLFATSGPCWPSDNALVIQPSNEGTDPKFLRYALQGVISEAAGMNRGAANPLITQGDLGRLMIGYPALSDQRAIAHILGTLDDKIELNRKQNQTLEAMARALFKAWFVDFEPVRAKMEGRWQRGQSLPGLPAHLYDIFPDRLVESELGEIPEGWSTLPVYEIAKYVNGAAFKAFQPNEERRGLPIIKIAELKAGVTTQTKFSDVAMPEKYRLRTGDILFSWSGNPDTSIDIFIWAHGEAWLNQHIFRVDVEDRIDRSFVIATLRYLRPVFAEMARNKQTTGLGHVTVADMKRLLVVKPDAIAMVAWDRLVGPIFETMFSNEAASISICRLRDSLLPKLISGELRIGDVEAFLKERGL